MVRLSDRSPPVKGGDRGGGGGGGRGRKASVADGTGALRGRSLAYVPMDPAGNNSVLVLRIQFKNWNASTLSFNPDVGPTYCDETCVRVRPEPSLNESNLLNPECNRNCWYLLTEVAYA